MRNRLLSDFNKIECKELMISTLATYRLLHKPVGLTRLSTAARSRAVAVRSMLLLLLFSLCSQPAVAGVTRPDSLARYAINTNMLYWLSATPNAGIEWAATDRFSLALSFGYNAFNFPGRNNASGQPANPKLHHWSVTPEGRLWLRRAFEGSYFGLHLLGGQFNAGGVSFPAFMRDYRYEGYAVGAGLSYGHEWPIGRHWRLGVSAGAGWMYLNYDKYECGSCGRRLYHRARNIVAVTNASVTVAYVFPGRRRAAAAARPSAVIERIIYMPVENGPVTHEPDSRAIAVSGPAATVAATGDTLRFSVYYDVDRHDLQNGALDSRLDSVRGRQILSVIVDGYASPEYAASYNLQLSERRARRVASELMRSLDVSPSLITVTARGDDWEGLAGRSAIVGPGSDVIRIMARTLDPGERKQALRSLSGYGELLDRVFPLLRRTDVTIIYR